MTECERLIADGTFMQDFFQEEMRCGFFVDKGRKKLWAILIDLYLQFKYICEQYGLRYCALGGTILGAARHRGFIPWDDDIDVCMPREDYNKFCELGHAFSRPYFLQVPGEDNDYCVSWAKLRNSNTTCMYRSSAHRHFNQGVFLDVFPLDIWDKDSGREVFEEIKKLNLDNGSFLRVGMPEPDSSDLERIKSWSGRDFRENLHDIDFLATKFNRGNYEYCTSAVCSVYPYDRFVFRREWFEGVAEFPFEMITMTVPVGYKKCLEAQYGDWSKLPPETERGSWHAGMSLDVDCPYGVHVGKLV